jgi:hypothetical protein
LKTTIFTLFLATFVAFVSCKKEVTPPVTPPVNNPTKKELVTKKWSLQEYYENGQIDSSMGALTLTFNTDGTYLIVADGDSEYGDWEFANNETQIIIDKDSDPLILTIQELTSTKLKVEWMEDTDTYRMVMIPA